MKIALMASLAAILFIGCGDGQKPVATEIKEINPPADVPVEKSDGDAKIDPAAPPAPVAE